jgi:NADPH-dependent FMN reductase
MANLRPLIVGIGGTTRPGSSSEKALRYALALAAADGADVELFDGASINLPMYAPESAERSESAQRMLAASDDGIPVDRTRVARLADADGSGDQHTGGTLRRRWRGAAGADSATDGSHGGASGGIRAPAVAAGETKPQSCAASEEGQSANHGIEPVDCLGNLGKSGKLI